ncbi:DsbA family oxidoreductase [Streptomyces xiamenensis]|uniref:DsbA family oxidoreductase n=1 Tax=Streptomyces TaxID=1883 RepID=UPI0004CBA77F|nr:DsbA family oxidoreductase [Streptomyces sp. NRRL F-2890]
MRIDVWSDVSCPWCYISKRTFERALASFGRPGTEVVAHPYQIDGEHPAEPMPMLEWLGGKYGADRARAMSEEVTAAGRGHGITFRNERGFAANTLEAHRLLWWAGRVYGRGAQSHLEELVFAAYFTEAADISRPGVLAGRAAAAGMDEGAARAFLGSREGIEEVRNAVRSARDLGIRAVPVYRFDGGERFEGAQTDPRVFEAALSRESEESTA